MAEGVFGAEAADEAEAGAGYYEAAVVGFVAAAEGEEVGVGDDGGVGVGVGVGGVRG